MGKIAFIFPGQGSQHVGMGKGVVETHPAAREVFDQADRALAASAEGLDASTLSQLCFEGPESALMMTANTQPAVLTTSFALYRALGEEPDVVAGHSLGEYTAHVVAGTLRFEDAVRLVRTRGELMQNAVPYGAGMMAAVMGVDRAVVLEACGASSGIAEAVNFNSPGQVVIAGETEAVKSVNNTLRERGAKVMSIPVSAPFHSSMMRAVEEQLVSHLSAIAISEPRVPVFANVDAMPVVDQARALSTLIQQVSRPVQWEECVLRMVDQGVRLFVEIGPGRVLTGLVQRIARHIPRVSVQTADDFNAAREAISSARAS